MIAVDTSSIVNFYNGSLIPKSLEKAMEDGICVLPIIVLTEFLSTPNLPKQIITNIKEFPRIYPKDNLFWIRSAELRKKALSKKKKARLADTLIAQICIDYDLPLITQDKDFQKFAKFCKLQLI